jgi:Type II secretory pathway, ATPase PulE/Tfp pilus assembly pathway, ATPase PilB
MTGGIISHLSENNITHVLNTLLNEARSRKIRDIHIEPGSATYKIRVRTSGQLKLIDQISTTKAEKLIEEIRLRSHLRKTNQRIPQESTFSYNSLLVQFTSLPIVDGEKIFLHITDQKMISKDLKTIGLSGDHLQTVQNIPNLDSGLVIVIGEGKTTTMFSILSLFDSKKLNISTVETRNTYRLSGVNQFISNKNIIRQTEAAFSATVKQHSDVILLSQIDSPRLAELAVDASLNNRLVITSLPITDPFQVADFLLGLDIKPFLLLHALKMVISQDLVSVSETKDRTSLKGVFEILEIDDHYKQLFQAGLNPHEIRHIKIKNGYQSKSDKLQPKAKLE